MKRCARWSVTMVCLLASATATATAAERKVGTIGPPPRKDPQRQTAAEGFPPLPLPAVPLRRSEPKAEPSPPIFFGKLVYGQTQDYMPNPGDLDNLLRHVRSQLDVWYGWQVLSLDDLVAMHAKGQRCQIPVLYITGYEAFELTSPQREALRDYLLDGGTLLGDATLGSPAFTASFRREILAMFPDRKLGVLQMDHPVMRGYYAYANVGYFTVNNGAHTRSEGPPHLLGMNLAARTAVILSPYDMTCGWDEFYAPAANERVPDAPRTMAMMPADALRMGINLVAYAAAQRRFAATQAVTRPIAGEQPQRRAALPLAQLRHQGDWNPDPNSLYQLLRFAAMDTSVPVDFELQAVDADVRQLADTPLVVMTGLDEPRLSEQEVAALRRHLQAGGFLFINNTSGFAKFDREARALVAQLFPDRELTQLPADHAIYHSLYEVTEMRDAGTGAARAAELEAITLDDRAVLVYSRNDTLAMLKGVHDPYANAYDAASARRLALNILCYAMKP